MSQCKKELLNLCNKMKAEIDPNTLSSVGEAMEAGAAKERIQQAFAEGNVSARQSMLNFIQAMMAHD